MYPKFFRWFASLILGLAFASAGNTPALAAPPSNDDFANALGITSFPFSATVDITEATNEPNEPESIFMPNTVWYTFTPTETIVVRATTQGTDILPNLNVYLSTGSGISNLQFLNCTICSGPITFFAIAGQTYYIQAGAIDGTVGILEVNLEQVAPPQNDNFANAVSINSLPTSINYDTTAATFESSEPAPTCAYPSPPYRTIWFAFTPTQNGTVSARSYSQSEFTYSAFEAIYSGADLNNLIELGCSNFYNLLTFQVTAGQTYYYQVGGLNGEGGNGIFTLENTPPPVASFYFYPGDPTRFDTIQFNNASYDPGGVGLQTASWNFGDGNISTDFSASHLYTTDRDYAVTLTVTTIDGRSTSITQTVQVRTHDVAIVKIAAPKSANAGQTREIVVSVRNSLYPETVRVDLYRSVAGGGFELIGASTQFVPVRLGTRTSSFSFNYTFSPQDAQTGKVVFWTVATIIGPRDALPTDNEAISSPTKVTK